MMVALRRIRKHLQFCRMGQEGSRPAASPLDAAGKDIATSGSVGELDEAVKQRFRGGVRYNRRCLFPRSFLGPTLASLLG
jgi:hypothetical protein